MGNATNVAGMDKFYEQASESDKRAKVYKQLLEELKSPMTPPEMPQPEQDAFVMLQTKQKADEHLKKIQEDTEKGLSNLKEAWATSTGPSSKGDGKGGYGSNAREIRLTFSSSSTCALSPADASAI